MQGATCRASMNPTLEVKKVHEGASPKALVQYNLCDGCMCVHAIGRGGRTCINSDKGYVKPHTYLKPCIFFPTNKRHAKPHDRMQRGDKSVRRRAESQWIVAARLLCHLQYPATYLSRLQRIHLPDRLELPFRAPGAAASAASGETLDTCSRGRTSAPTISRVTTGEVESAASSMDSDLEAFSHNPTHGSFAPLAFQPSAMTNYVNQRFLSY